MAAQVAKLAKMWLYEELKLCITFQNYSRCIFPRRLYTVQPTWIKLKNALAPKASSGELIIMRHSTSSTLTFLICSSMFYYCSPLWIKCKDVFPFSSSQSRLCFSSAPARFLPLLCMHKPHKNSLQQHFGGCWSITGYYEVKQPVRMRL